MFLFCSIIHYGHNNNDNNDNNDTTTTYDRMKRNYKKKKGKTTIYSYKSNKRQNMMCIIN